MGDFNLRTPHRLSQIFLDLHRHVRLFLTLLPFSSPAQVLDLNCILRGLFASSNTYLIFFTEIFPNKSLVPQIQLWGLIE